jgi:UDP-GlcNAc:undecaprenyl-phosphate GlcNAc-1-phosphate transferase
MNNLLVRMLFAALLAGGITVAVVPLVKQMAHKFGAVRAPRARDVHDKPMPMWGGLAMFAGFVVAVLVARLMVGEELTVAVGRGQHPILGILVGATLIAIVGMLDDHPKYDLPPRLQTLSIFAGALIAALLGARIEGITNPLAPAPVNNAAYTANNYFLLPFPISVGVTLLWAFLATKTFDFLDGLDGLAAGVCAISGMTMALLAAFGQQTEVAVALMASALVGASFGFLRHNYNPASIFMGTPGSQFLGFVLAMLSVVGAMKVPAAISLVIPLLVLGVPVFDGLYVAARRIYLKKSPTVADKTHIHHRLRDRGLSVRQAVWVIYALTTITCMLALLLAWKMAG